MLNRTLLFPVVFLALACSDDNPSVPTDVAETIDTTGSADVAVEVEAEVEPEVFAPPDMGDECLAATCAQGQEICYRPQNGCRASCMVDQRTLPRVMYCSMPCAEGDLCPLGFSCLAVEHGGVSVMMCGALPPVCGNGRVDVRETCDDGNTDDGDFCSAGCSQETMPSTSGRVTVTIDDEEPRTIEGETVGGFARLQNGDLTFRGGGIELVIWALDETTTTDIKPLAQIRVFEDSCEFGGLGYVTLTAFDLSERHIAGRIDSLGTACSAQQCFGCGSGPSVSLEFDMVWLDWPPPSFE